MSQYCENCKTLTDELTTLRAENAALLEENLAWRESQTLLVQSARVNAFDGLARIRIRSKLLINAMRMATARLATDSLASLKSKLTSPAIGDGNA